MFFSAMRNGEIARRAAVAGVSFLALASVVSGAQASTLSGTFGLSIYQGVTGSNSINDPTQQALLTNPLIDAGHSIGVGTYTGAIDLFGPTNSIDAFLASAGGTVTGTLTTIPSTTVLSTSGFDVTTVFVFTGTLGAGSGTITHDDGIGLYDSTLALLTGTGPAVPTPAIPTSYFFPGGAFTLVYVEANGLPAVLDFETDTNNASTTPLPAGLPLFASGLGALGLLGWRRKRKASAALAV